MTEDFKEKRDLIEHRERLARERGRENRLDLQSFRREIETANADAKILTAKIAASGNIEAMRLDHDELDPERRERNFQDAVRFKDLDLQALQAELIMRLNAEERSSLQRTNEAARMAMIEIIKLFIIRELGLGENREAISTAEAAEILQALSFNDGNTK